MFEAKAVGVQGRSRKRGKDAGGLAPAAPAALESRMSVAAVADQRMSDPCKVHTDLMGAAGLQMAAEQRGRLRCRRRRSGQNLQMGDRSLAPSADHRSAGRPTRIGADSGFKPDPAVRMEGKARAVGHVGIASRGAALTDAEILAVDVMGGESSGQGKAHGFLFCDHEQAAGSDVETVDDSRTLRMPNCCQRGTAMGQKGVSQGAVVTSAGGMHEHARRLVDDQKMGVFVQNRQRQRLRSEGDVFGGRHVYPVPFAGPNGSGGVPDALASVREHDSAPPNHSGQPAAAERRFPPFADAGPQCRGEGQVKAQPGFVRADRGKEERGAVHVC